ncbi:MAG TPA: hypothetical protein VFT70_01845 [Nocardioides sp.]|nr:hypothetical protein [Nocardioides sp.]
MSARSRLRLRGALLAAVLLTAFLATTARVFVWPSLPPLPAHADAIVELAGPGNRDASTIALAEKHIAPLVIQSTVPGDATSDTCLDPIEGATIECFSPVPDTTRGEARYIGRRAADEHWRSVIIVTTPDHAWRARLRVERCFPGRVYVATSPLPKADWLMQIPYQWAATAKAELFQRGC